MHSLSLSGLDVERAWKLSGWHLTDQLLLHTCDLGDKKNTAGVTWTAEPLVPEDARGSLRGMVPASRASPPNHLPPPPLPSSFALPRSTAMLAATVLLVAAAPALAALSIIRPAESSWWIAGEVRTVLHPTPSPARLGPAQPRLVSSSLTSLFQRTVLI